MTKLMATILLLATVCGLVQHRNAQTTKQDTGELHVLGNADQITYVDLGGLPTSIERVDKPVFDLYNSQRKPESFYHKWNWRPDDCWAGSTLREGVVAYCLPHVRLGYRISTLDFRQVDIFVPIGRCSGVYVWYELQENRFYLWSACWNFEHVLGPFIGDPNVSLKQAVKPSKGRRHFPGVSLTMVSQRWVYPDENQARMPRDEHYDCAHGHLSGRAIEAEKLNSFITRFQLVNGSGAGLYYLTNPSVGERPAGYGLTKYPGKADWDRTLLPLRYVEGGLHSLKWRPFPGGMVVEFEVTSRGWQGAEHAFIVLLNDEPVHWDEVELLSTYPTMFRTFKSEAAARP